MSRRRAKRQRTVRFMSNSDGLLSSSDERDDDATAPGPSSVALRPVPNAPPDSDDGDLDLFGDNDEDMMDAAQPTASVDAEPTTIASEDDDADKGFKRPAPRPRSTATASSSKKRHKRGAQ